MSMARLSLKSVLAHKVRLILTILSVVLGTAFVSGAMMFTNSLDGVFNKLVTDSIANVDAVASPNPDTPITLETLDQLRSDSEIAKINVDNSTNVVVAKNDKEPLQTGTGSTALKAWYDRDNAVISPQDIVEGDSPAADEIVVNAAGAKTFNIKVGDQLLVVDPAGRNEYKVAGIAKPEGDNDSGLSIYANADQYIERYLGNSPSSLILAGNNKHDQELIDYLQDAYPTMSFESGQKIADSITEFISKALDFVQYFLVAFALIALFVGTFIIANTFAMIVAQRFKEFALLRALGMSRPQLTLSVILEAVIVGIIGSILGLLGGIGLVKAIQLVMAKVGMELDGAGLGIDLKTVLITFGLGILVTVVSAWAPAQRAGAVRPVEAMRSTENATASSLKIRTILGFILLIGGVAACAVAVVQKDDWETKQAAITVGVGAFISLIAVYLISPAVSIPIVGVLGRIIGAPFGIMGKMAATNSRRNPKRTATTAFALTLGLALVTTIGMLSATLKGQLADLMDNEVSADFVLTGAANNTFPVPATVPGELRELSGVDSVLSSASAQVATGGKKGENPVAAPPLGLQAPADGQTQPTPAADAATSDSTTPEQSQAASVPSGPMFTITMDGDPTTVLNLPDTEGEFDLSKPDVAIMKKSYAEDNGWKLGDLMPVYNRQSQQLAEVKIIGLYGDSKVLQNFVVSNATLDEVPEGQDLAPFLVLVKGTDPQLRKDIEDTVSQYLVVRVQTPIEYAGEQTQGLDKMLNILYALVALSVIVAVIGIINTLALNVIERRQEIGMLRAVGTHRRQIRTMITVESVQIAIYGALLGVAVGLGLGWSFLQVLASSGLDSISIPWKEIAIMLVGSAVVGMIAAFFPALRAAKTPPLEAIAD